MDMKPGNEYSFRHKIAPFLKGFVTGGPLVEVALEGLRRGVAGERGKGYESRVASKGNVHQICEALAWGVEDRAQLEMARALRTRFDDERSRMSYILHPGVPMCVPAVIIHAPKVTDLSAAFTATFMWKAIGVLESGSVTSVPAQAELIRLVLERGTANDAARLLRACPEAKVLIEARLSGHE